jgi:hypothetical protein
LISVALLGALPAYALATADLAALSRLERGRWQVRDLDARVVRESICIGDATLLARIEHLRAPCTLEVVESEPAGGTVRYSCPGRGFGHSTLKVETPRLAKIHTQGISDNRPFSYRAEARRTGPC